MTILQFSEPADIGAYAFPADVPIDMSKLPVDEQFVQLCVDQYGAVQVHAEPQPEVETKTTKKRQSAK